jgi:hypothetical protein
VRSASGERRRAPRRFAPGEASLADHAERQKLVPLETEDRPEALDVVVAVEAVAALRPARREEALAFQVADLRDRDVGKLVAELLADRPDRQSPFARVVRRRRHHCRFREIAPRGTATGRGR